MSAKHGWNIEYSWLICGHMWILLGGGCCCCWEFFGQDLPNSRRGSHNNRHNNKNRKNEARRGYRNKDFICWLGTAEREGRSYPSPPSQTQLCIAMEGRSLGWRARLLNMEGGEWDGACRGVIHFPFENKAREFKFSGWWCITSGIQLISIFPTSYSSWLSEIGCRCLCPEWLFTIVSVIRARQSVCIFSKDGG